MDKRHDIKEAITCKQIACKNYNMPLIVRGYRETEPQIKALRVTPLEGAAHRKVRKERKAQPQFRKRMTRIQRIFTDPLKSASSAQSAFHHVCPFLKNSASGASVSALIRVHLRFFKNMILQTGFTGLTGYGFNPVHPVILSNCVADGGGEVMTNDEMNGAINRKANIGENREISNGYNLKNAEQDSLFFGELPKGWILKKFGDILSEPVRNGVYKKKEFHGRGQKIINMGELFAYNFISNLEYFAITLAGVFTAAKDEALRYSARGMPAEPEELRRLDHRARTVLALFTKAEQADFLV